MIGRLFRRTPRPVDPGLWQAARARACLVARLDPVRDARLQRLAARFLHDKTMTPVDGLALDDGNRVLLAALCCLPLLEFGEEGLHGWTELILYPAAFRVGRTHVDATGVMHAWDDDLIGESWDHGPLILSWADVEADLAEPAAGFCVAVHEMAHKLDALDGAMDGTPPLPRTWQHEWARDFQQAFDAFADAAAHGRPTAIDRYAAEAPEEFFAVCSEYHFSDPARLHAALPAVAGHLARFYGVSHAVPAPTGPAAA
ncbi:MAG TPA: M90 family metallopeptidase [Luteimonas sp.]|nr:M90 family metallopeptidase [Luteimonas sp.]